MKRIVVAICFLLVSTNLIAQKKANVDSLKRLLLSAKTDTARMNLLNKLSRAYEEFKPDSVIYFAKQLLALSWANRVDFNIAIAMGRISYAEYNKGNYAEALKFGLQEVKIFEKQKDPKALANAYNGLGNIFKGQENYTKAVYYYKKCQQTAISCGDKLDLLYSYLNLGNVYGQINRLDSAVYYANKAISFTKEIHLNYGIDYDLFNLGTVNFKQKRYKAAYDYYHKALKIAHDDANFKHEGEYCVSLAEYFYRVHPVDSALYYAHVALSDSRKSLSRKTTYRSAELLSVIYEGQHQTDSAFKYLKLAGSIKDSIYNTLNSRK